MPATACGLYCDSRSHYFPRESDQKKKSGAKRKRSHAASPKKAVKRRKGFSTPKRKKHRHNLVLRTQLDDMANDVVIKVLTERGWHAEYPYRPLEHSTSPVFYKNMRLLKTVARGRSQYHPLPRKCLWWVDWAAEGKALMETLPENVEHIVARFPGTDTSSLKHHITNKIGDAPFYPKSFVVPTQKKELLASTKVQGKYWIAKPTEGDNGQGIRVYHSDSKAFRKFLRTQKKPIVVQRYIANPALVPCAVEGKGCRGRGKFHIRTYAVCTSVNPLEVYSYRYSYAECASRPFTLSKKTLGDDFDDLVHITNTMIQRIEENKDWLQAHKPGIHFGQKGRGGNILGDRQLHKVLKKYYPKHSRDAYFDQIKTGTAKSVEALMTHATVQKHRAHLSKHSFFELFGLDWMVDENLKLWLLEINATPGIYLTPDGGKLHWGGMDPDRHTVDADVIRLMHDLSAFLAMDNYPKGNARNWVRCHTTFP